LHGNRQAAIVGQRPLRDLDGVAVARGSLGADIRRECVRCRSSITLIGSPARISERWESERTACFGGVLVRRKRASRCRRATRRTNAKATSSAASAGRP
jgi:hypothetical protein